MFQCIQSFCFCFSLRAGTLIIGYTLSVSCVIASLIGRGAALVHDQSSNKDPYREHNLRAVRSLGICVVIFSLIYLCFCVSLIVAAHRYMRRLHFPWMVATAVMIVLIFIGAFHTISAWLLAVPGNIFLIYCLLVVYSRYGEMDSEEEIN